MLDWDGTLLDNFKLSCGAMEAVFRFFGVKPPPRRIYGNEITADWPKFYYSHGIPKDATPSDINDVFERYCSEHASEKLLRQGTIELLFFLKEKKISVVIVTASPPHHVIPNLKEFGIFSLLDGVYCNARPTKRKAFKSILRSWRTMPPEAFYLGDSASDLIVSKKMGILTIGITTGFNSPTMIKSARPKPDFVVRNFPQLIKILNKIIKSEAI